MPHSSSVTRAAVVGVEGCVGVEMDHGRSAAVGRVEHERVDRDLALLEVPVRPHRLVAGDVTGRGVDVDRHGQAEEAPEALGPRPGGDHDLLADRQTSFVGLDGAHRVVVGDLEPAHLDARKDPDAGRLALVGETLHGLEVEGEAALVLVEADRDSPGAPVREQRLHVRVDLRLADEQGRVVADPLVALVDRAQVALLRLRAESDVAHAVVVVCGGVRLPHLDARLHELAHRRLEVVVADDAAGDAGGTGAGSRLVEDDDVGARAGAALLQLDGEVVRGRQAVHAGADDDEAGRSR